MGSSSILTRRRKRSWPCGLRRVDTSVHPELGELEFSITPRGPVTPDSLRAYADAGVDRLIVYPLPVDDEADVDRFVAQQAEVVLR